MDLTDLSTLTLDLTTITLGEMAAVEIASKRDFTTLLKGQVGRRLIALYLREWRSSGVEPSWSEISSHRPLASTSSISV